MVQSTEFPPVVILPSRTQRLPVVLNRKITDGNYTLRTSVNLGNGEIQEATLVVAWRVEYQVIEAEIGIEPDLLDVLVGIG